MLTHIVCWKYHPEISEEDRVKHIDMLRSLPKFIPEIVSLTVGRDILSLERSYDTGLVAVFENRDTLEIYTTHPAHADAVALGKRIGQNVVSVDLID